MSSVTAKSAIAPPFFGWKVVVAILVVLTFSSGLSFYNHAVILNALARQPNFSVASVSLAVSLFFVSAGFAGLWVARLLERFDPRLCLAGGALLSAGALAGLAWVEQVWQLYGIYLVFGAGFSATALVPATTLVSRWFHRRRALALSIATTGLSLGGVLITPLCAAGVEAWGLATTAPYMGLAYLLGVVPVAWWWIRPSPESLGQAPDGADRTPEQVAADRRQRESDGISFTEARRHRFFWGVSLAYVLLMLAQVGGIAHQYGLAQEMLSDAQTAMALAILPVASIVGRLVGGWVMEQVRLWLFALVMMLTQVVSLSLLASGYSALTLCLGLALFGITVGNLLMLQPLIIAAGFGVKEYSRIYAMSNLMSSWGTACGPALLGVVYGWSGQTYGYAYGAAAVCGLLGLVLFLSGGKSREVK